MSRLFLPAATNYATNPSFETDTNVDGQSDDFAIVSSTQNGTPSYNRPVSSFGGYAQRYGYTGVAADSEEETYVGLNAAKSAAGSFASGEYCTISFYIKGTATGITVAPYWESATVADAYVAGAAGSAITLTTDWQRVSISTGALAATTSKIGAFLKLTGISENDTIEVEVDRLLIEKSPIPTPYFDGASSDSLNASTYAWTGAANASTSTRAASVLTFSSIAGLKTAGTVAARIAGLWAGNDGANHELFAVDGGGGYAQLLKSSGNNWQVTYYDTGAAIVLISAAAAAAASTHSMVGRWVAGASGTLDLMVDGAAAAQVTHARTAAGTWPTMKMGGVGSPLSGYLTALLISPQRKSDAWTTAMDTLLRAASVDLPAIKRMMAPGDALFTGAQADASNLYVKGA